MIFILIFIPLLLFQYILNKGLYVASRTSDLHAWLIVFVITGLMGVFIFCHPLLVLQTIDYFNPPPPGPKCGNPMLGLVFLVWVLDAAIGFLFQMILYRWIWKE